MATEDLKGSIVMTDITATPVVDAAVQDRGARVRRHVEKVEITAKDIGSTYLLARLPSNAVLLPMSRVHWDVLDGGTATMDVGIINRLDNGASDITNDVDALWDNLDITSQGSQRLDGAQGALATTGISNLDQELWEYVAAQSADPKVLLDIQAISVTTDFDTVGTIVLELYYVID